MSDSRNIQSIGYSIFAAGLDDLPTQHQTLVNTLNQYSYCIAEEDAEFKESLQKADVLLPDGVAIVVAVKMIDSIRIKKIAGADLHNHSLEKLNKPVFSADDNAEMLSQVNNFKPDVLFVGMTAPKQEKWAYSNKTRIDAQLICSIGAVFDFYAGTVQRPSDVWIDLSLEWLGRLVKEPKRMWKRYLYYGPVFFYYLVNQKFKK